MHCQIYSCSPTPKIKRRFLILQCFEVAFQKFTWNTHLFKTKQHNALVEEYTLPILTMNVCIEVVCTNNIASCVRMGVLRKL